MNTTSNQNDIFLTGQKTLHLPGGTWDFVIQNSGCQNSNAPYPTPMLKSEIYSFIADWELPHIENVD